jgi:hypothetical protein
MAREGRTTIEVDEETRDRLRRYKSQDGRDYDEAISDLLDMAGWEVDDLGFRITVTERIAERTGEDPAKALEEFEPATVSDNIGKDDE